MPNNKSLQHAKHNEEVCNHLFIVPSYTDWVITTAFYSSLHYVSYKIFPLTVTVGGSTVTHQTFDSYVAGTPNSAKKHKVLSELVQQHCPIALSRYNQLKDLSWTARYKEYRQTTGLAALAKQRMEEIRDICI